MKQIAPSLTPEERGYVAGLLDGEGTIGFHRISNQKGYKGPRTILRIMIANNNIHVLQYVRGLVGHGSISSTKHSSGVKVLLPQIVDLLHIKQEQARIALEYLPFIEKRGPSEFAEQKMKLHIKMHELNKRGGD